MADSLDLERALAYEHLLALPDERALRGKRGHHITRPGDGERLEKIWSESQRVWTQARISQSIGEDAT